MTTLYIGDPDQSELSLSVNDETLNGLVNFGDGLFDGSAAAFTGGASGTAIAGNYVTSSEDVLRIQQSGVDTIHLTNGGALALAGAITAGSLKVGGGTSVLQVSTYAPALTPAAVAANTSAEQTFTVTGLATNDKVFVNKPSAQAGLGIVGMRVSAANTLAITYGNFTAAAITPTAETYQVVAIRS